MNKTKALIPFLLFILFTIITSTANAQNKETSCGTIYGELKNGIPSLLADEQQIKIAGTAYWIQSGNFHVTFSDVNIKYTPGNPNIYLVLKGKADDTTKGSVFMAFELGKKDNFLYLNCDAPVNGCVADHCSSCGLNYDSNGKIEGCKCNDTKAAGCNHTISSGIDHTIAKFLPTGKGLK